MRFGNLHILFGILSLFCILNLIVAISGRLFFPWPLEWMEGAMLHHALRILGGESLYGPPTADFIPFLYPPLFHFLTSVSVYIWGQSLVSARLPSILALIGLFYFVGKAASYSSGQRVSAILAAGLLAMGYGYGEAFYDLARLDTVFLFLIAAGTDRLQRGHRRTALVFLVLSCVAKQHGFLFLAAASSWLIKKDLPGNWLAILISWLISLLIYFILHIISNGWSTIYLFKVPSWHGVIWKLIPGYLVFDLLFLLPVLSITSFFRLWRHFGRYDVLDSMLIASLIVSALGRAHAGGNDNVLLPGFVLLVIVTASDLASVLTNKTSETMQFSGSAHFHQIIAVALFTQYLFLFQPPSLYWPAENSSEQFRKTLHDLKWCAENRSSVVLDLALLTGTPFLHTMELSDIITPQNTWLSRMGINALTSRLTGPQAPYAIAVGASFPELNRAILQNYRMCKKVEPPRMSTGYQLSKLTIYRRIE